MVCEDLITLFGHERIALREPQVCRNHLGNQIREADLGSPAQLFTRFTGTAQQGLDLATRCSCREESRQRQQNLAPSIVCRMQGILQSLASSNGIGGG
jgi:hypothetical protein